MEKEAFIYTISSEERLNIDTNGPTYNIMFGGFNTQYDNFKCEVMSCTLSNGYTTTLGYISLIATNLNENGLFCPKLLQSDTCVVAVISTNAVTARHDGEIFFNVKNCRVARLIKFQLILSTFAGIISGTDINIAGNNTNWILILKMIPID